MAGLNRILRSSIACCSPMFFKKAFMRGNQHYKVLFLIPTLCYCQVPCFHKLQIFLNQNGRSYGIATWISLSYFCYSIAKLIVKSYRTICMTIYTCTICIKSYSSGICRKFLFTVITYHKKTHLVMGDTIIV